MGQFKSSKLLFWKIKGKFELGCQGQGHQFLKQSRTFRLSKHSSSLKLKFLVQKLLHSQGITQKFKFHDQFDLEGQGQGHQFSNPSETVCYSINSSSWKVKFEMVKCLQSCQHDFIEKIPL